jgi:DNA-directed RNA polymerase subunit RPC12/RpoP
MASFDTIDVQCPLCGKEFSSPNTGAGAAIHCPHCGNRSKMPGAPATQNDDDQWLRLDEDLPPATVVVTTAAASKPSSPMDSSFGKDIFDNPPFDNSPFDDSEFQIPDLPPAPPLAGTQPGTNVQPIPPLSAADLAVLSGFADEDDQQPAPVKVVRDAPQSDSFRVKCPICESLTYAKLHQVGKKIRCGDCHSTITVPPPPKVKPKYQPDIEATKAYTFQDGGTEGDNPKPADPMRKSASDYLRDAEAAVETKPEDDWEVPSVTAWLGRVVGIFRDPAVIVYWLVLTAVAAIPASIAIRYSSSIVVMGLFAGGIFFAGILMAHGIAILQSVANGEKRVSEWPSFDFWDWLGSLFVAASAVAVAAGPVWLGTQYFFGPSLITVAMTMASLYMLYPFVLLSMLDEQSVFVPFSTDVSKSVMRSSERWGELYLSSAIVFFLLFLVFMFASIMTPIPRATLSIAASVAAVFVYFGLIGQLAFSIGQAVNAPPMANDVERKPKLPS